MHSRAFLFTVVLTVGFLALPDLASAKIPFLEPIIPQTGSTVGDAATCPLGWPALITVINNIISLLITIALIAVAPLTIAYAGFLFVVNPVNAGGKEKAKTILWQTVLGIGIALSAYLIVGAIMAVLYKPTAFWTTWSDIVTKGSGDLCIKLASSLHQAGPPEGGGGGDGASCENPDALKTRLNGGAQMCAATSCQSSTVACATKVKSEYGSMIEAALTAAGMEVNATNKSMVGAIICRESGGNPNAHAFDGGCGLMQITPCTTTDPQQNIKDGVRLLKQKLAAVGSLSYSSVTHQEMAFAAYNCCSNGDNPNAQSRSCKVGEGWPSVPKWVCPIDPGVGEFNMCFVKGYACDVSACVNSGRWW